MKTNTTTAANLKILLVEDNVINQEVAMFILTKKGYNVLIANNGEEAVTMAEKEEIDLLLMDVQMPRMNGYQATEKIREMELNTGFRKPIIGLTANAMKGDKEKCLQAGMDAYLTKPIIKEELYRLIASIVPISS
jgi:two-component system, sensor histidine kinase and response regulator